MILSFKKLDDLASVHEARRVEVERAKGRGCLMRSVKLARLVRYGSTSIYAARDNVRRAGDRRCFIK